MKNRPLRIFIVAGEPSGDMLGTFLMRSLKKNASIQFKGVGGDGMLQENLDSIFPLSAFSIMAVTDIFKKLPQVFSHMRQIVRTITEWKPDLILTIDYPGFNFHLGKKIKHLGIPHVHLVAPTVWAWKRNRAKKVSRFLTHLLTLFPFEPPYFIPYGLPTTWVGHPLVEAGLDQGNKDRFRKKYGISSSARVLLILPGSRISELKMHLPIFLEMAHRLEKLYPDLCFVIPTLPSLQQFFSEQCSSKISTVFVTTEEDKRDAHKAAFGAVAASGTVTLELALAKVPMIMTYKVSTINKWIAKLLIKIPYFCMINILLKREVVPELLQDKCNVDSLVQAVQKYLMNPEKIKRQKSDFKNLRKFLQPDDQQSPSETAAKIILDIIHCHQFINHRL